MTNKFKSIEQRADALLSKRGITGHTAAVRFVQDFKAYLVYFDATGVGSASDTLTLLEDDANLTDSKILNKNFRMSLTDLISDKLNKDPIFPRLFKVLLGNKGKGVGQGELVLPLVLSNYRFSNESDGVFGDGKKVELKDDGASLKPVPTGLTEKGLVDVLNKKYWNGTVPGMRDKKKFAAHLKSVTNPSKYADYLKELYVGCDTKSLAEELMECYTNSELFNTALGKFALREYKKVDGWNNIMFIDAETQQVVNIANVDKIDNLGLKFRPVMRRGKDTQAIADGYVNVSI